MKQIKFLKKPWQIPVLAAVTIYGIVSYGFLDLRVIALFIITLFFVVLEFKIRRKKKLAKQAQSI